MLFIFSVDKNSVVTQMLLLHVQVQGNFSETLISHESPVELHEGFVVGGWNSGDRVFLGLSFNP